MNDNQDNDSSNVNMIDLLLNITKDGIDMAKLRKDEDELNSINKEFPEDGLINIANAERLAGLSMRGITICDYWIPILMVILGSLNSLRNKAKNEAYVNAKAPNGDRVTADLRKHMSEIDPEYNQLSLQYERIKSIIKHFEDKRDAFKTFHFFMKDQQKAYGYLPGRHITGEGENAIKQKKNIFTSHNVGEEDF